MIFNTEKKKKGNFNWSDNYECLLKMYVIVRQLQFKQQLRGKAPNSQTSAGILMAVKTSSNTRCKQLLMDHKHLQRFKKKKKIIKNRYIESPKPN